MYIRSFSLVVVVILLLLAGCASKVTSEVTRFHQIGLLTGQSIKIEANDPELSDSIEFRTYSSQIAQKLSGLGYRVVEEGDSDYTALVSYNVGAGEMKIRSLPDNYVHYHFHVGQRSSFYFGRHWPEPEVYSYTVYPRQLEIQITDGEGKSVFEGRVQSIGKESNINQVMEYLIDAMFQNFPGESGVTKVVTIYKDDDRPY